MKNNFSPFFSFHCRKIGGKEPHEGGGSSSKVWNSAILFVTLHCDSEEKVDLTPEETDPSKKQYIKKVAPLEDWIEEQKAQNP